MNLLESLRSRRRLFDCLAALACVLMLGYAYFLQFHRGLEPCPLCIFQRIAIAALALAFVLAAIPPAAWRGLRRVATVLVVLAAGAGVAVAARHLYIQSLPPGQVPVCGATLDYMWEVFPAMDVLRKVLTGSGECARIDWTFLGLAMPAWVMICAVVLGVSGVLVNWPARRR
ncbi:MAG TPA: disulfide bond formation protein B [Steroidobacteraceae bacterium]|nr:disulfide bond formation protein B [Steroidobacteraceae bacterium]